MILISYQRIDEMQKRKVIRFKLLNNQKIELSITKEAYQKHSRRKKILIGNRKGGVYYLHLIVNRIFNFDIIRLKLTEAQKILLNQRILASERFTEWYKELFSHFILTKNVGKFKIIL